MRKALFGLIPLAALALAGWLVVLDRQGRLVWDHWDEVKRGVLYRSGQLTGPQLTQAVNRYKIRTVINLQLAGPETIAERELSASLGVDFVNLPMPGDGFGEEWQFREILKIIDDPDRCPVLVHCARGTCRTGAAVALYRLNAMAGRSMTLRWKCVVKPIAMDGYQVTSTPWRKTDHRWPDRGRRWWKTATEGWRRQSRRRRMNPDRALVSVANHLKIKSLRTDHRRQPASRTPRAPGMWIAVIGLALGFVVLGADALDLGPQEARLGMAAGERPGPVGQVFGYWAPDLWPAQVWSSHLLALLEPGGRPSSAAVRWPAALAGIIAGWILVSGMSRRSGFERVFSWGSAGSAASV